MKVISDEAINELKSSVKQPLISMNEFQEIVQTMVKKCDTVVTCAECAFWKDGDWGMCSYFNSTTESTDYCSRGRRRD